MTVRPATPEDLDTVIELLNGLAEYEHASEPFVPDRGAFAAALFGRQPQAEVLLAEADTANGAGESVGLALFFAKFNVWNNAISTGGFAGAVAPGATDKTNVISVNSAEWARTPAKGVMVVTFDNASGAGEAQLLPVDVKK